MTSLADLILAMREDLQRVRVKRPTRPRQPKGYAPHIKDDGRCGDNMVYAHEAGHTERAGRRHLYEEGDTQ